MISVKELIDLHKPKIDWEKKAKDKAKERGISAKDILEEWDAARLKGLTKGKALHERRQLEMENSENYIKYDYKNSDHIFIYEPSNYKIEEGYTYDEKPFVHPKRPLIGIPDRVYVKDNKVHIIDFKSDKAIYKVAKTFKNNKFVTKLKFASPISHMDFCNYIEYNLQLSLYMRLILDNNKTLHFGSLTILHTIHNEDTLEPLTDVVYDVPYLRKEVETLLKTINI